MYATNLNHDITNNGLSADDIVIPDYYFNRDKTDINTLDNLFGGCELPGFVKGVTFSLSAAKGSGKTTGLMQILGLFKEQGKNVCYISSEQSIFQLAFTAKRIGASKVPLASFNYIEDAIAFAEKNKAEFVVFDSLQKFQTKQKVTGEDIVINSLIRDYAQRSNAICGVVLHRTKTGKVKGDSSIEHDVDINLEIFDADKDLFPENVKIWKSTKNRFGETFYTAVEMTNTGFNWENPISAATGKAEEGTDKRTARKNELKEKIIIHLKMDTGVESVLSLLKEFPEFNNDPIKCKRIMKELEMDGKVVKSGRGDFVKWNLTMSEQ